MLFRRCFSTLPPTIHRLLTSPTSPTAAVRVDGWVKSVRRQKRVSFAVITDGSCDSGLQVVFNDVNIAKNLTNGTCVRLNGTLGNSLGKGQEKELQVQSLQILGECDPETYPIQKKTLSAEYLRDNCHLRARTDGVASMLRLRNDVLRTLHAHFETEGFCYVHTPILTSNDCEGAGEAFRIASITESPHGAPKNPEFFSRPSYLTVSSQLHLEALATAISRVYTLSPCFRAEPSLTSRHLAEFWMLEAEWAFTQRVDDVCLMVESTLKNLLGTIVTQAGPSLCNNDERILQALEDASRSEPRWTRMTYTDAVSELSKSGLDLEIAAEWGKPLRSEHEKWLAEHLVRGPVFVTDYPIDQKPFYMRVNDDGRTAACFDLLVPRMGELAGGSLREERSDMLKASMHRHGLGESDYGWYLDLRKYGGAPHGGFGMGFERLIGWLSGIESVRECIAMPRWAGRMLL